MWLILNGEVSLINETSNTVKQIDIEFYLIKKKKIFLKKERFQTFIVYMAVG